VKEIVKRVRAGEGPWLLEVSTYRWKEHVGPSEDYHLGHRTEEEAALWIADDPVRQLGENFESAARARLENEVDEEIADAFVFAEASPFPEPEELLSDVLKEYQDA
jgi:TPP-dependent pyruvate/acetoin dehydrogenase alpha subunit